VLLAPTAPVAGPPCGGDGISGPGCGVPLPPDLGPVTMSRGGRRMRQDEEDFGDKLGGVFRGIGGDVSGIFGGAGPGCVGGINSEGVARFWDGLAGGPYWGSIRAARWLCGTAVLLAALQAVFSAPFMCDAARPCVGALGARWEGWCAGLQLLLAAFASAALVLMGVTGGRWADGALAAAPGPGGGGGAVALEGGQPFADTVGWAFWGWVAATGLAYTNVLVGAVLN